MSLKGLRMVERSEDGRPWPALIWQAGSGWRMISTAIVGGGLGRQRWWLNAQVDKEYFHPDPARHARAIAAGAGARGPGVAMLTAADVTRNQVARDEGVEVVATVGLGLPVWAAEFSEPAAEFSELPKVEAAVDESPVRVGTINLLVVVPVALSDAALVNAVLTATEAKAQALFEEGVPGTGTSSDALCVACPEAGVDPEPYAGPRSLWGGRIARAVHTAVADGTRDWFAIQPRRPS